MYGFLGHTVLINLCLIDDCFNSTQLKTCQRLHSISLGAFSTLLTNMRGADQTPELQFNPAEDSHSMSVFESEEEKKCLERELTGRLIPGIDDNEMYMRSPVETTSYSC